MKKPKDIFSIRTGSRVLTRTSPNTWLTVVGYRRGQHDKHWALICENNSKVFEVQVDDVFRSVDRPS